MTGISRVFKSTEKWIPLYHLLKTRAPGEFVSWNLMSQLADHDVKRSRGSLIRAKKELEKDGLGIGHQNDKGIWMVQL